MKKLKNTKTDFKVAPINEFEDISQFLIESLLSDVVDVVSWVRVSKPLLTKENWYIKKVRIPCVESFEKISIMHKCKLELNTKSRENF